MSYLFSIEVRVSSEGSSWSGEGEHRQWDRDGNVHTDLQKKNIFASFVSWASKTILQNSKLLGWELPFKKKNLAYMTAPNKASYIWVYKAKNCLMKGRKKIMFYESTMGLAQSVLYTWICLHTQRPFGECSGKEKRKNRRLLHGGLERRTAQGRHRIPQHVNSKHRT